MAEVEWFCRKPKKQQSNTRRSTWISGWGDWKSEQDCCVKFGTAIGAVSAGEPWLHHTSLLELVCSPAASNLVGRVTQHGKIKQPVLDLTAQVQVRVSLHSAWKKQLLLIVPPPQKNMAWARICETYSKRCLQLMVKFWRIFWQSAGWQGKNIKFGINGWLLCVK